MNPTAYRSYRGLPALAGLARFQEALQPGLSVEKSVDRLKRHHYVLRRMHHMLVARITSEPIYELKMAFSYHAYLCAETVTLLRERVGEMREPPLGLERVPHPALEQMCNEVLKAPKGEEFLLGFYERLLPLVSGEIAEHAARTHPLADQPTRRLCRIALADLADIRDWAEAALPAIVDAHSRDAAQSWLTTLVDCARASTRSSFTLPPELYASRPFQYDRTPRRDERFPDPYNMGVNAEAFLYDPEQPPEPKVLMMFYKRLREIDVPEMMAGIITETEGKPWEYYRDMTRQLWDEARHAMIGEVGFVSAGVDWPRHVMVNFTWSLGLNTQLTPRERHAVLYFIEQGLMPKTGKRHEWEVSLAAQNALAATFQDFDWADEVLHARIGRDWYVSEMPSAREAVEYGDKCWSRVLSNWEKWRQEGLTEHRNWWPDLYRAYCEAQGQAPDENVLAFNTSYASTRADLKPIE